MTSKQSIPSLALALVVWNLSPESAAAVECHPSPFVEARSFPVGSSPRGVVIGDFNNDSVPDLAVSRSSNDVSVLLGDGDAFVSPPVVSDSVPADSLAIGFFDADSNLDIALAGGTLAVQLGNGDGTFDAPVFAPGLSIAAALEVADLDSDGELDLVAGADFGTAVFVLIGNGDGTFGPPQAFSVGAGPRSVTVADVDGGPLDVVTANFESGTVSFLPGNGDGTFEAARHFVAGPNPSSVAVADFNSDGERDILVTAGGYVALLLGAGDGIFLAPLDYFGGRQPNALAVSDVNGDGLPDVALLNRESFFPSGPGTLSVLFGDGAAGFSAPFAYRVGGLPFAIAADDLDGDGRADLAVTTSQEGAVSVAYGSTQGTFLAVRSFEVQQSPVGIAAGDFNEDSLSDLAVLDVQAASVFRGLGDGSFAFLADVPSFPSIGSATDIATADFDGDSHLDLVITQSSTPAVSVFLGRGDGTFGDHMDYLAGFDPLFVAVGDLNGDSKPDLVVSDRSFGIGGGLSVLLGDGTGGFLERLPIELGGITSQLALVDLNSDGKLDIAVARSDLNAVQVLLGNGDGSVQPPADYAAAELPTTLAVGDVNGDEKIDLVVGNGGSPNISILRGKGDGSFEAPLNIGLLTPPGFVATDDFNDDGSLDVVVTQLGSSVSLLLGVGNGTFQSPSRFGAGEDSRSLEITDVDGNGHPDIAAANFGDSTVSILQNARLGVSSPPASVFCVGSPSTLSVKAAGYGPVSYQWRKGGVNLSDAGAISGVTTATLTIDPVTAGDAGSYDVVVEDLCTSVTSSTVVVTAEDGPVAPVVSAPFSAAPGVSGLVASVPEISGHTYEWTITGGTIEAGQGTSAISFTAGPAGTTVVLQVTDTSATGCESAEGTALVQVDFLDVPPAHPFHDFVVRVARQGISSGCGAGSFCPSQAVTRAQMSVLVLKGEHGGDYVPPGATGTVFGDVSATDFAAAFIEQMAAEGLTSGCGAGNFCPAALVTRGQAAVFLLRAKHGSAYTPPAATGVFADVPVSNPFASWIEQFAAEGISSGCGGGNFCPSNAVTRGQMSVFLVKTFGLP